MCLRVALILLNKLLKPNSFVHAVGLGVGGVGVLGLVEVNKFRHIGGDSIDELYRNSRRCSGQHMGLGDLGIANSNVGDYNLFSSDSVLEFILLLQCWFHKVDISAMYDHLVWTNFWM